MATATPMHSWPNIGFADSVYEWQDEQGRTTHCTYQEIWWAAQAHRVKQRRG